MVWTTPRVQTLRTIPPTLEWPRGHRPHPPGVSEIPPTDAHRQTPAHMRTRSGRGERGSQALEGAGLRLGDWSLLRAGGLRSEQGDAEDRATGPAEFGDTVQEGRRDGGREDLEFRGQLRGPGLGRPEPREQRGWSGCSPASPSVPQFLCL